MRNWFKNDIAIAAIAGLLAWLSFTFCGWRLDSAAMSDNEKMDLAMLGSLAIALPIIVIVSLLVWYR